MQQSRDGFLAFLISLDLQIAIEDKNPRLKFPDDYTMFETMFENSDSYHKLCLQDFVTATEMLLDDMPSSERRTIALQEVESAFRDQYPDVAYPSLDARLVDHLRNVGSNFFRRKT